MFKDDVEKDGWGKLWVKGLGEDMRKAWYAAGFAEGALTAKRIHQHYVSWYSVTFPKEKLFTPEERNFMLNNYVFAKGLAQQNKGNAFYDRLGDVIAQTEGLVEGINSVAPESERMNLLDVLLLQAAGDLYDIIPATNASLFKLDPNTMTSAEFRREWHNAVSCSALVKISDDLQDVLAGHTTWSTMENMLRVYKHYSLGNAQVSFSSKPGLLYSKDDFYVLPRQQMVVMETTNGIMNKEVYGTIKPDTLLTWQRIPIANSLTNSGKDWTDMMTMHSSGTYANQWIVVDAKRFKAGAGAQPGFLWIIEQAGKFINEAADVTEVMLKQGNYFASYNVPFFESVYNKTGFRDAYAKHGDEYSYSRCPRAQIFAREQHKVQDIPSVQRMLRFNKFDSDPLSGGNPDHSISARSDLAPDRQGKAFGGIDSKVTNLRMLLKGEASAENGPTHDDQPAFRWSTSKFANQVHDGQPDLFNFTFVDMRRDDGFRDETKRSFVNEVLDGDQLMTLE